MVLRLASVFLALLSLCEPGLATSGRRHWRIYHPDPDTKVSVCYPTDMLQTHKNEEYKWMIDLKGPGGAAVFLNGRPDKYVSLNDQLDYALDQLPGGPRYIHESGPGLTPVHYVDIPRKRITRKIVRLDWYLLVAEDKREVEFEYAVHVDHAIKSLTIIYPKSRKVAWQGIPERMRACFKSLGPITNPMVG